MILCHLWPDSKPSAHSMTRCIRSSTYLPNLTVLVDFEDSFFGDELQTRKQRDSNPSVLIKTLNNLYSLASSNIHYNPKANWHFLNGLILFLHYLLFRLHLFIVALVSKRKWQQSWNSRWWLILRPDSDRVISVFYIKFKLAVNGTVYAKQMS